MKNFQPAVFILEGQEETAAADPEYCAMHKAAPILLDGAA